MPRKKKTAKPEAEKTTKDLNEKELVDFLVTTACNVIPQGVNPQAIVKEYERIGNKIKKALKK